MSDPKQHRNQIIEIAALSAKDDLSFEFVPDAEDLNALQLTLDLRALRKVRLEGRLTPRGKRDWDLKAQLGATVVQACVITLEPVTTRIESPVLRSYLADPGPPPDAGETEMPEDDSLEPLSDQIDLLNLVSEALALALPDFPRTPDAELKDAVFTEPGKAPLSDEDIKPFAGLKALRDGMSSQEDD